MMTFYQTRLSRNNTRTAVLAMDEERRSVDERPEAPLLDGPDTSSSRSSVNGPTQAGQVRFNFVKFIY